MCNRGRPGCRNYFKHSQLTREAIDDLSGIHRATNFGGTASMSLKHGWNLSNSAASSVESPGWSASIVHLADLVSRFGD